jgi:hypothetical protein
MAWRGVTCGARGQRRDRVTALELPGFNLSGTISPKIANLAFLTRLDLSKNQLHGTVPHELSLLLNLNHLGLSFNTLGGNILPPFPVAPVYATSALASTTFKVRNSHVRVPLFILCFYYAWISGKL